MRRRHWLIAGSITVAVPLLFAALYGIIGNRADAAFLWLVDQINQSIRTNFWPWGVIALLILLAYGITILLYQRHVRSLNRAILSTTHILELDDSLLRLLASWVPAKDHEAE